MAVFRPRLKKIDFMGSEAFLASLLGFLGDEVRLILDLSEVQFIDSSGLGKIVAALRAFRERGGDLRICGAQAPVEVLFTMVRLGDIVGIYADEAAAAEGFAADRPSGNGPAP